MKEAAMTFIFRVATKFIKYGIVSTGAVSGLAIATKPSLNSFDSYLNQCYKNEGYDNPESLSDIALGLMLQTIKRKYYDFLLFRMVIVKLGGTEQKILGAFNTWTRNYPELVNKIVKLEYN